MIAHCNCTDEHECSLARNKAKQQHTNMYQSSFDWKTRAFLLTILASYCSCLAQSDDSKSRAAYMEICKGFLTQASDAYDNGGIRPMIATIYRQHVAFEDGAYLYCYRNLQENGAEVVRLLSPYLPPNVTLGDVDNDQDPALQQKFYSAVSNASLEAIDNCCGKDSLFEFSLPFNQAKSSDGKIDYDGERDFVAFSQNTGDEYFFCACPLNGYVQGPRNNTYAERYLADLESESESTQVSTGTRYYAHLPTAVFSVLSLCFLMMPSL